MESKPRKTPPPLPPPPRLGPKPSEAVQDGELPIGAILAERYQVLERISAGGMGVVYKARHLALDDIVAVKLLLKPQDETDRKRFLIEARLATKIKHPNTVYVSDFGILPDGRSYLVMEFMRGQVLSLALKGERLEPLRACRIAVQIARGLQAVHDQNIVHRDLKPDNIFLISQDGQPDAVKIVDFGIAKATTQSAPLPLPPPSADSDVAYELESESELEFASSAGATPGGDTARLQAQLQSLTYNSANLTVRSAILGTPRYMSPEAIKGKAVDGRADQYSLGCILFELLSGHLPFQEEDLMGLLTQHMYAPVPELRLEVPMIAESLAAIVVKLLSKKPEDRYESMNALAQELDHQIELMQVQRGERAVISAVLAGRIQGKGLRTTILLTGRAIPLWALAPVALLLILGGAGLGGRFLVSQAKKEELRPNELRELRRRALTLLRNDIKSGPDPLKLGAVSAFGQSHDRELGAELEPLLRSDNAALRAQAAEALGQLGERQIIPVLLKVVEQDALPGVRLGAAIALAQLGEARGGAEINRFLDSPNAELQRRAVLALCDQLSSQGRNILTGLLARAEQPGASRLGILTCLARGGDAQAVAALREQVRSSTLPAERIAAQVALAELGDLPSREALRQLIQKRGADHLLAARLLAGPDEQSGRAALRHVVADSGADPEARRLGAEGLGAMGELFDVRLLGEQISTASLAPELRQVFAAAIVLIAVHDPGLMGEDSLAWALGTLGDGDWLMRQSAVQVLGDVPDAKARTWLVRALQDKDWQVRAAAARALGQQSDRDALQALHLALADSQSMVRLEALRALAKVALRLLRSGSTDLSPLLHGWLRATVEQGTISERVLALGIFLHLGERASLPELVQLAGASSPGIRRLVVEQLDEEREQQARFLTDSDAAVRAWAAVRLGAHGDRRAIPVLIEASQQTGAAALAALAMLDRLQVRPTTAQELGVRFNAGTPEERLAAVAGAVDMRPELALQLLLHAARDSELEVRQRTTEVAAELPLHEARPLGWPLLQILVTDRDVTVRMRARALLAQLQAQLDAGKAAAAGRSAPASGHSTADGQAALPDLGGSTDLLAPPDSVPASALASGNAQEQLGRAQHPVTLSVEPGNQSELCYQQGRLHESRRQWPEAMAQYMKYQKLPASEKQRATAKAVKESISRLAKYLGRVQIYVLKEGRCQLSKQYYLTPGEHTISVGSGESHTVSIDAGTTTPIRQCP